MLQVRLLGLLVNCRRRGTLDPPLSAAVCSVHHLECLLDLMKLVNTRLDDALSREDGVSPCLAHKHISIFIYVDSRSMCCIPTVHETQDYTNEVEVQAYIQGLIPVPLFALETPRSIYTYNMSSCPNEPELWGWSSGTWQEWYKMERHTLHEMCFRSTDGSIKEKHRHRQELTDEEFWPLVSSSKQFCLVPTDP